MLRSKVRNSNAPQKNYMKHGKKYRSILEKIEKDKKYSIEEAVKILKDGKIAKFDESVEVHIKTNIDPKKGDEQVRGSIVLPNGIGKSKKVAVITSTKTKEAEKAGAEIVGGEELIEKFSAGKLEGFDILIATPEMMPKLAKVAKILGPRGLMPSPKTETVTDKIEEAVAQIKKGKLSFKNDNQGNLHQIIGKISLEESKLAENYKSFFDAIQKAKPAALKGKFITSITVCSTMSPGIKISL
jgi:large subunit ribosomal protein L1